MRGVVLDTCIILDMLLKDRNAHPQAGELANHLIERGTPIFLPMHAFFEVTSAIMCEKRTHGGNLAPSVSDVLTEKHQLKFKPVPIDFAFIKRYATGEAPNLKSGDMIFVLVAKVDDLDLITEEDKMLKEAKRLGVSAYSISDYLGAQIQPPTAAAGPSAEEKTDI